MQGAVGEVGNLYLIPPGAYLHPIYNDVNGGTDKLLTASLKAGYLGNVLGRPLEVVAFWRLLTPTFAPAFEHPELPVPVGRYADWMELKMATTFAFDMSFLGRFALKHQPSLGFNHIGNKGGREMHRLVHRVTGNSMAHLEYTDQPVGYFVSGGYELSLFERILEESASALDHQFTVATDYSKVMREASLRYNLVYVVRPRWWEMAVEVRFVHQINSAIYTRMRSERLEAAFGTRVFRYFTPTIKYVSPYLIGDDIGQTYFDALHFNWEF